MKSRTLGFDYISEAMTSDKTYPLLDDTTGKLISTAAKEGKIHLLGTSSHKAKQVGLSAGLISRIPLFDNASMDEILDIRKELNKPLTRFRSAIINFSNEIASAPWQEEFPQEVDFIYWGKVEPAILELEEAIKSNKSLLNLVANSLTQGLPGSSIIGLALSQITNVDSLLALTITAGLSTAVYKEIKEKREKREAIESHQLYFYYRAKNLLQKK